jgi:hypothetical protein
MGRRERRRVLVLMVVAMLAFALFWAWLRRAGAPPDPEQRARDKALELRERARELTR